MTLSLAERVNPQVETSNAQQPGPFRVKSYKHLLQFPADAEAAADRVEGSRPGLDAIIVPTIRSAEQLHSAAELARQAQCQLLTFYTESFPAGLGAVLARLAPGRATALAVRPDDRHPLLRLGANIPQSLVPPPAADISRKRNIGLLIGRACGWTKMLFLDDDVRALDARKLRKASALLPAYPVVGLQVKTYPDASVVGHIRRITGYNQDPFISGGALLVDPQRLDSFFPSVYHEDWLCIINHLRRGEAAIGGTVGQLSYSPFNKPQRAVLEEFGDILASGLLWLVNARAAESTGDRDLPAADFLYWQEALRQRFWEDLLKQRVALLDNLGLRLKALSTGARPLESLVAAKKRLGQLEPQEFVSFTETWLGNLACWRDQLADVPRASTVAKAIAELALSDSVRSYSDDLQRG